MQQISLTIEDVRRHDVELVLPPEPEFEADYRLMTGLGREAAAARSVAFVAICRNAMPFLPMTIARIEQAGGMFRDWRAYVFENDSADSTKDTLSDWSAGSEGRVVVSLQSNGRPHLNFTKANERTIALAEYRDQCRAWVENETSADYVVVFDTDSWGGFSVDGLANSIGHLERDPEFASASGMASYSWCVWGQPIWQRPTACHYDGWAFRWTWWKERQDMTWFHLWHPPVGSRPIRVNSAFGQLAVYRGSHFVRGRYAGHDCEHVPFHRSLPGPMYLNPSSRVVSFWHAE